MISKSSVQLLFFQDGFDTIDLRRIWNAEGHNSWTFVCPMFAVAIEAEFPSARDSRRRCAWGPDFADVISYGLALIHRWKLSGQHSRFVKPKQHPRGFRLCCGGSAQSECREKEESREPFHRLLAVATQR